MFPNSHQDYIPREVLTEKGLKISFSQNGEDSFITSYFWLDIIKRKKGYYLDIGCFNEGIFSNTKLLSIVGWEGIGIDANPIFKSSWEKNRPNDLFISRCICKSSNKSNYIDFFRFKNRQNSTADKNRAKDLIQKGLELNDIIKVKSISLPDLARELKDKFLQGLDFLSIDLEYLDYLDDIPEMLEILKPRLICMEIINKNTNIENLIESNEYKILKLASYNVLCVTGDNLIASYKGQYRLKKTE